MKAFIVGMILLAVITGVAVASLSAVPMSSAEMFSNPNSVRLD